MTWLIEKQIETTLIMFGCGLATMLIFESRQRFIKVFKLKGICRGFVYLGSWLAVAFLFCRYLYFCTHGVPSAYSLLAYGAGILLWRKIMYGIIDRGVEDEKTKEKTD